jgi:hypothetical protein
VPPFTDKQGEKNLFDAPPSWHLTCSDNVGTEEFVMRQILFCWAFLSLLLLAMAGSALANTLQ